MKKKLYEKPTMQVVKLQSHCNILAGSNGEAGLTDYTLENEERNW